MKVLAIKSSPNMLMANTHLILKTFIDGMKQTGSEVELSCYKKIEYYTLFLLLFILDSDSWKMHPKRRYANALTKGFKSGSPEILKKVSIELVPQMDFAKAFSKNLEKRIGICKKTKSIIPHNLIF